MSWPHSFKRVLKT
jgi:hypothetical protein